MSALYLFPSVLSMRFKLVLVGITFLIALSGLLTLEILSYWSSIAAMIAIAFTVSYISEKRLFVLIGSGEKNEINLSFSDGESGSYKEAEKQEQQDNPVNTEIAVSLDEISIKEEPHQITPIQQDNEESDLLEIESLEIGEIKDEDSVTVSIKNDDQVDLMETRTSELEILPELTEDEFAFLSESREFEGEESIETPVVSDINDEELISQRTIILDELEELEDLSLHEGTLEAELELVEESEEAPEVEDMLVDAELQENEVPLTEGTTEANEHLEAIEPADSEALVSKEEQTNEASTEEMVSILVPDDLVPQNEEEPGIPESTQMPPQEEHHESAGESEVEAESQHDTEDDTNEEPVTIETNDAAAEETESVKSVQPHMDPDLQDMLLTTLTSYEHQGDTDSYNDMLQSILNQTLSDQDYYLFSKLLLEHYLSVGDTENSKLLLTSMKARLSEYPIIAEELEKVF
jgi:hypothetical protein